eukprot:5732753-Heterocapsa_arctica.AAC.1
MLPGFVTLLSAPAVRSPSTPASGSSDSHLQKCGPTSQLASSTRQGRQGTLGEPGSLQPAESAQGGTGVRPDGRPILL